MDLRYQDQPPIQIEEVNGDYTVTIADRQYRVHLIRSTPSELIFSFNDRLYRAHLAAADQGKTQLVALDAIIHALQREDEKSTPTQRRRAAANADSVLTASMPGQVIKVLVEAGEAVKRGQTLIVLEAMKMEIRIASPQDGNVKQVLCEVGVVVERGQTLIELQPTQTA
ncbi:MAG: biotin/lipoyl-binding protein [Anaerolineae bacterium]|nr:biotin/lipoyl-binding protein [Anaerolineae bacterium]